MAAALPIPLEDPGIRKTLSVKFLPFFLSRLPCIIA
jgi:hypothetical protein